MILYLFLGFVGFAAFLSLADWRRGIYFFILVGLLQDPVRKLVPGTPGYLVLATTPVWIAMIVGMMSTVTSQASLERRFPALPRALKLFILSLVPAALISATYGAGSWMITILGIFTYGSFILSVVLGYRFSKTPPDLRRVVAFYCLVTAVLLGGSLLEYFQIPFPALGTEMLGTEWIRHIPGVQVHMMAGFFRSPDVMGWHAAAVAMLAVTLATLKRDRSRWFWLGVAAWAAAILILCGRRKMVYMVPLFIVLITWLPWQLRKQRILPLVAMVVILVGGVAVLYQQVEPDAAYVTYYTHNPGDVYAQVERHGFDALVGTYRQSGFFGEGLGFAATGAHHVPAARPRIWQESGPSRALVELGVPGFLCFLYLGITLVRTLWRLFRHDLSPGGRYYRFWIGLFAMIVANAGSFVVSGQIFGDPFISIFLTFLIGGVLSAGRLEGLSSDERLRESPRSVGPVRPLPAPSWLSR